MLWQERTWPTGGVTSVERYRRTEEGRQEFCDTASTILALIDGREEANFDRESNAAAATSTRANDLGKESSFDVQLNFHLRR